MATTPQAQHHPEQIPPQKSGSSIWIIVAIILGVLMLIIAVLAMMLIPAISSVRGAARRVQTQNNARQIVLAMHNYEPSYKRLPANVKGDDGSDLLSWRYGVLPWLGQQNVFESIERGTSWDDPASKQIVEMSLPVFQSMNGDSSTLPQVSHFVAVNHPDAALYGDKVSLSAIKNGDGLGNTALFFEHPSSDIPWAEPRDVTIADAISIIQGREEGTVVAMADASVIVVDPSASAGDITKLFLLGDGAAENLPVRN